MDSLAMLARRAAVIVLLSLALAALVCPGWAQETYRTHAPVDDRARATHRFKDAEKWAKVWDDPSRDAWQEPGRIVEILRLEDGMTIVDLGAGTGYFNSHLSAAVGPKGVVYPVDIEETLVAHMRARALKENTPNVRPVLGTSDDPRLPVAHVDRVLLVNTYHHIDGRIEYFRRLRNHLAPGGLLVDVDWKPGELKLGPAPKHKIAPDEVIAELERAGFQLAEQHELEYQYVLVFRAGEAENDGP